MKVYVSTTCLSNGKSVFDVLDVYQRLGIENVELGSSHKYEDDILARLQSYTFHFLVHNYFPPDKEPVILNLTSTNHFVRRASIAQVKRAIDLCVTLGSLMYTVHGGYRQDPTIGYGYKRDAPVASRAEAFEALIESVVELNEYGEARGVKFGIENIPVFTTEFGNTRDFSLMCEAWEFDDLFLSVPSSNLGMLLDLAHLEVNAYHLGFDKHEFIDAVRDKVIGIHVSGNDGRVDGHTGIQNDVSFLDLLTCFLPDTPIVLEARDLSAKQIMESYAILVSAVAG